MALTTKMISSSITSSNNSTSNSNSSSSSSSPPLSPIPEDKHIHDEFSLEYPFDTETMSCLDMAINHAMQQASQQGIHAMINFERTSRRLPPLQRSPVLDHLARGHATFMARECHALHSVACAADLQTKLQSRVVAENILHGQSTLRDMHQAVMNGNNNKKHGSIRRQNILYPRFTEMGCAMAQGTDGKLYVCQLFRRAV